MLRLLFPLLLLFTAAASGQDEQPGVELSAVDGAIEHVSATLAQEDPAREALLGMYGETRIALLSFEANKTARDQYILARDNAFAEVESILAELAAAQQQADTTTDLLLENATLNDLEQKIQVDKAELVALKSRLADIRAEIDSQPGRPTEIRTRLTELITLLEALKARQGLMNQEVEPGSEDQAKLWRVRAELASTDMERAMLDAELLSQPMRLELLKTQQDKAVFDISVLEKRLATLEQRIRDITPGRSRSGPRRGRVGAGRHHG